MLADRDLAYGIAVFIGFPVADLRFGLGVGFHLDAVLIFRVVIGVDLRVRAGIGIFFCVVGNQILGAADPGEIVVLEVAGIGVSIKDFIRGGCAGAASPGADGSTHDMGPDRCLCRGIVRIALTGFVVVGKDLLDGGVISLPGLDIVTCRGFSIPFSAEGNFSIQINFGHGAAQVRSIGKFQLASAPGNHGIGRGSRRCPNRSGPQHGHT